jgi:predicted DNA-binding transcriptional regulator AlpA
MLRENKQLPPLEVTGNVIGGIYPELQPYVVVRRHDGYRVFGLKFTAQDDAIARDEIPRPIKLGKRASGWTGHMINEYYRKKAAKLAEEQKARAKQQGAK